MSEKMKKALCFILSFAIAVGSSVRIAEAKEIYSTTADEMKEEAIACYGWDEESIDSYEWVGLDGEDYKRIYAFEEEMYKDTVKAQEQLAVDFGILNKNDLMGGFGFGGGSIVAVALREAAADDNMEIPMGSNHCKYTEWYGAGDVAWCVIFIVYCANECGYLDSGLFPRLAWCDGIFNFFVGEKGYGYCSLAECTQIGGKEYSAVPGDIVLYECHDGTCTYGHIGLVTAVGDGFIDITQGNTGDRVQTIRTSYSAYGNIIIHIPYPDGPAPVFSYLTGEMGMSPAAACGVMGNLYAESLMSSVRIEGDYSAEQIPSIEYTDKVDSGQISRGQFVSANGYGLVQFTYSPLKAALYDYAKGGNPSGTMYSIGDLYMQLQAIQLQLNNCLPGYPYDSPMDSLRYVIYERAPNTAEGVCMVSDAWLVYYEKPAVYNYGARQAYALEYWAEFGGEA